MNKLLATAAVLVLLTSNAANADTLQDTLNATLTQRLQQLPAPVEVAPYITFDFSKMSSQQRAGFVIALHIHSKICTTPQPEILVRMAHAIVTQAMPDGVDLAKQLDEMQKDASRGPGEWCRTVSSGFKTFVE